jgi:hypothetical protein
MFRLAVSCIAGAKQAERHISLKRAGLRKSDFKQEQSKKADLKLKSRQENRCRQISGQADREGRLTNGTCRQAIDA